ncbi:sodium:proton antiporter [bacterium]|nr:sodium:proton antiporter [bacterium]
MVSIASAQEHHDEATEEHQGTLHAEQQDHHGIQSSGHNDPHGGGHDDAEHGGGHHVSDLGKKLPLWSVIPFVGILLSIALFPLFAPHWWHHNFPKVSIFWALLFAIPFLIVYKGEAVYEILHIYLADYIPFIILLLGLFVASGGIYLKGTLVGTPKANLILLVIGTIMASWMGTTGASMVLIRPVLRANQHRKSKMHVVIFFIFLVSNIGGSLTPLGDPPLFLGFLHGVPFFWTLHLIPEFLTASITLLVAFFILDSILYRKDRANVEKHNKDEKVPLSLHGSHNFLFLIGVMAAVLFSGIVRLGEVNVFGVHMRYENIIRDVFIIVMVILSMKTTSQRIRKDNGFTWFPILEVAYLFAGIFMCIIPALAMLKSGSAGHLAFITNIVKEPIHYYFITGGLSAFLDNAPTYLTFFNLSLGNLQIPESVVPALLTEGSAPGYSAAVAQSFYHDLVAISVGAVFFGAMTYIGNAPNFMVRSIAEENKVAMPSFFGYMIWSVGILGPLFVIISLIFF